MIDSSYAYYNAGKYKKSMEFNMKILNEGKKYNNAYYVHKGYRFLAYDYMALRDTLMARESFEKAQKFATLSKNDTAIAVTYMDLANFYSLSATKEKHRKTFTYHEKSIELLEKIKDTVNLAKAHYNMVLSALHFNEYNLAYLHLLKTKRISSKFDEDDLIRVGINYLFGQYYFKKKQYALADSYLLVSIEKAEKNNFTDLLDAYDVYSQSLFMQKRFEEAYKYRLLYEEYLKKSNETKTSIESDAVLAQFKVEEYRRDVKAAELQNQLQTEVVKNQNKVNNILIIVSACTLLVLMGFFFAYRRRKQLVEKLKVKNKEYLQAKEETERLSKSKSKFFSTVSHELRTPLYGVIGLSSILLEDKSLKKHEKDLKSLKFSADYLMALINDVLKINKIDANTLEEEQTDFELRALIKTITTSFEYMRQQNNNNIHIDLDPDVPAFIRGDSVRLSQVLMNLIGNACKFTENGEIHIIVGVKNFYDVYTTLAFTIKDNGRGIAAENNETIFEEFSQSGSPSYKYQGTGLGLPIVKKLLSLSNSEITLVSDLGKGAAFSFDLTFEVVKEATQIKQSIVLNPESLNGKKILVVEDNRINQIVTKKILEKYLVDCMLASNGKEAVDKIKKHTFDLVLMDINMPVKNGLVATREVRKFNKTLPIIALTAVEIEELRQEIFNCGMNDIIVKPYDSSKFIEIILKTLNASSAAVAEQL